MSKRATTISHVTGQPQTPKYTEKCRIPNTKLVYNWSEDTPLLGRALLLADKTLFVAGPPDLFDAEAALKRPGDPAVRRQMTEQTASFKGRRGGLLLAVNVANGEKLAEYPLKAPPTFDGMAAADGALFMATTDGSVVCFRGIDE